MYAFIVGFNEWVLEGLELPARAGNAASPRTPTAGNMTVRSSGS